MSQLLTLPHLFLGFIGLLPMFVIPGTYHHFMFDEPMATVTAIKGILLNWRREENVDELNARFGAFGNV